MFDVDGFASVSLLEIEQILSTVDDTTFGKFMRLQDIGRIATPSLHPSPHPLLRDAKVGKHR